MSRPLLIDTDCGVDDALAILLALSTENFDIKAITCCFGNTSLENVWKNVLRVTKISQRTEIPVYIGCDRSLIGSGFVKENFHGQDGFGNIGHTISIDDLKAEEEHASLAMVRLVNKFPGEITLVALGPLTNLAVAQRLDPNFSSKLKELVVMGGNIHGRGNIVSSAEFNFFSDPESAFVVLKEFSCPMLCIPWETCIDQKLSWDEYHRLMAIETPKGNFVRNITKDSIGLLHSRKRTGYHCCDLFAMAVVVDDKVAKEVIERYVTVELKGEETRGQMVVDHRVWNQLKPNLRIVTSIDVQLITSMFEKMLM